MAIENDFNDGSSSEIIDISLYRVILDNSTDPIFCFDRTGKYLYINNAFAYPFNKQPSDIIGKRIWDIFPSEEGDQRFSAVKYAFETGEMKVIEVKVQTENLLQYYLTSVKPVKDASGYVQTVICISKDITDRKLAEEALKESESRLMAAQSMAHVGSWELNLNTKNIWASEEAFNIYGIERISPYLPLDRVQESVLSEYRESLDIALKGLITKNEKYDLEFQIKNLKTGKEHFVHSKAVLLLNETGNVPKVVGTIQDITERKEKELEIIHLSYHDKLTGLYNRRFCEEKIRRLDTDINLPISIIIGDVNGLKLLNDAFGHDKGDELLQKAAASIRNGCRKDDIVARWGGDEFVILLPKTKPEEVKIIIKNIKELYSNQQVNALSVSISFGWDTKRKTDEDILKVLASAEDYMYKHKILENEDMRGNTISTIINTLHEKNPREEQHSKRVSEICQKIGIAIGFSEIKISKLKVVGLLHDIGKIAIEEGILNKPGKLAEHEWDEIKRHPDIGYRILSSSREMLELAEGVSAHHEKWDGTGYPKGLKGEAIPTVARIIALADSYDAMTSERPYRNPLSDKEVLSEIRKNAGTQFDPEIARIFVEKVLKRRWD